MRESVRKVVLRIAQVPADGGATAVEYCLMAGLIALVVISGVFALGQATLGLFSSALVYPFGP